MPRYIAGYAEAEAQRGRDSGHGNVHILTHLFTAIHFPTAGLPQCKIHKIRSMRERNWSLGRDPFFQPVLYIFTGSVSSHTMLCFDPGSALFVSVLPSTNLIFSSLFMSQRKLIRVDSARETRRVCRVEGGLLRLCVCVCLCVRHSVSCMHGVSSKMQWRKI